MPEPRNPRVEDLERAAALHWQAPDVEPLGDWLLRAAEGFTGRANSALPLGDPSLPLAEAVTAVEGWYRRRNLRPMIVLPQGAGPGPRAVLPVPLPRVAPVSLHACALSETRRRGAGTGGAFSLRL